MVGKGWQAIANAWPSLGSRNFRLYIGGQVVSLAGTYMQQVALAWLVYRLTQSSFTLGAVAFAMEMCGVAVVLFGGLLADRVNPHRIVLVTQSLALAQALVLAALAWSGRIDIASIVLLSCLLGVINGFDVPARQVLVLHLVERREHLRNAIVLTSIALDAARLVGPSLGGALVASLGEWPCFAINAASYLAVIVALLAMRLDAPVQSRAPGRLGETLAEGIRYAAGTAPCRYALLLVALVSFSGSPYTVLMPVMAAEVFGGGPHTLGLLMTSTGIGALSGAMFLGLRKTPPDHERLIALGSGIFGASLVAFAFAPAVLVAVPLLVAAGFGIMILMASSHTHLLTLAEADKRGRVMSLFTLSFMASVPFGSLAAGSLASAAGAPAVIALGGALCVAGSALYRVQLPRMSREHPQEGRSEPPAGS